jgi:hypothetical protein
MLFKSAEGDRAVMAGSPPTLSYPVPSSFSSSTYFWGLSQYQGVHCRACRGVKSPSPNAAEIPCPASMQHRSHFPPQMPVRVVGPGARIHNGPSCKVKEGPARL